MDNPTTKSLIKNGIKIIREIKLFSNDGDFTIADRVNNWVDLALDQLNKMGEDDDIMRLLKAKNPFYSILFPSFDLSQRKNKRLVLKEFESFIDETLKRLIQLKTNKETSAVIYIKDNYLYTIKNGKKHFLFKRRCKREKVLKELILKRSLTGTLLCSTFEYKTFSSLSKEIAGINEKSELLGLDEKIIENGNNGYYINESIKIFDQS